MSRTWKPVLSVSLGTLMILSALVVSGCDWGCGHRDRHTVTAVQHPPRNRTPRTTKRQTETKRTTNVQSQMHLLDADAFDLEAVIALMTNEGVTNMEELERRINAEDSGINNVDINNDEQTDYVGCSEVREDGRNAVDFIAYPSGVEEPSEDELVTVASVTITRNTETNQVEVSGGYPEYVNGHQDRHYSHSVSHHHHHGHGGSGFATGFFLGWFLAPRPIYAPVYGYSPYGYMGGGFYTPRPVVSVTVINNRRSSYRSNYAGSFRSVPRRTARPAGYSIPRAQRNASKVRARYSSGRRSSGFAGRTGGRASTKRPTKSGGAAGAVKRSKAPTPPASHRAGQAGRSKSPSKSPARPSTSSGRGGARSFGSTPRSSTPRTSTPPRRSSGGSYGSTPPRSSGSSYGSGRSSGGSWGSSGSRRSGGSYGGSRGRRR